MIAHLIATFTTVIVISIPAKSPAPSYNGDARVLRLELEISTNGRSRRLYLSCAHDRNPYYRRRWSLYDCAFQVPTSFREDRLGKGTMKEVSDNECQREWNRPRVERSCAMSGTKLSTKRPYRSGQTIISIYC